MILCDITKKYGENIVLDGFSLEVSQGEKIAIVGVSGAGKSTLLNIIAGLVTADGGAVTRKESFAYMFQEHRLLPWLSVRENILVVLKKEDAHIADKYIDLVGIREFCDKKPEELSGGMVQRASFARFLAYAEEINAALLLLDEPFSALDEDSGDKMLDILCELATNKTVIMVTHNKCDIDKLGARVVNM